MRISKVKVGIILGLLSLMFVFVACNKGAELVKELEGITATACACKDKACAEKSLAMFRAFMKRTKHEKTTKENGKKGAALMKKMGTCLLQKGVSVKDLMSAARGQ